MNVNSASFNQSAATRFANTRVDAKRHTMLMNPAAQQSLRKQVGSSNISTHRPPVGLHLQPEVDSSQVEVPTGGPQAPAYMAEGFDPKVFAEEALDTLVGQIRMEKFMESPRVKDAMESIRLTNIMNADNPNYVRDPRSLFEQVVTKIGTVNESTSAP